MGHKIETIFRKVLHIMEMVISVLTLLVLGGMLIQEIIRMFTQTEYFANLDLFLHSILSIVVGLEFVRMLVDLTPANTLEVLIVAIARQVILSHDDPVSNLVSVVCIAGLFAIRRFLIPKEEMTVEMTEIG